VQMDGVTQQNAALVEESAATTQAMHEQAQALAELVALFRVDGGPVPPSTRPAAPTPPAAKPALPPARRPAAAARSAARTATKPAAAAAGTAKGTRRPAPAPASPAAATVDGEWEEF